MKMKEPYKVSVEAQLGQLGEEAMLNLDNSSRMRVASCQQVIQDISHRLAQEETSPRIVAQLNRLQELLALIDHKSVSESDLGRLEISTNQLLRELTGLFDRGRLGPLYGGRQH